MLRRRGFFPATPLTDGTGIFGFPTFCAMFVPLVSAKRYEVEVLTDLSSLTFHGLRKLGLLFIGTTGHRIVDHQIVFYVVDIVLWSL